MYAHSIIIKTIKLVPYVCVLPTYLSTIQDNCTQAAHLGTIYIV